MNPIRYTLKELKEKTVPIGREGENEYTVVTIDCAEVYEEHPNAVASMKVQNPNKVIYPVVIERSGNDIIWTVKASDLTVKGDGRFQLTFTEGTMIHKTVIGRTLILKSLVGDGTAPDQVQDWLDEAEDALEDLVSAEVHQPIIGEDGFWYKWNQEDGEYQRTDTKAQGEDGQDGHTPEKGVDYWTAADKAEMESDVARAIIDDTSTALNKTWSASKSNTLLSALTSISDDLQEVDEKNFFIEKVTETGSAVYDITYDNHSVNDATGQQASSESATRCSTPDLYYVPFGCIIKITGYNDSAQTAQYYCFAENGDYLGAVYNFNDDGSLRLIDNTRYVRFYMQNKDSSNITPAQAKTYGTYTCHYVGKVKELRDDVDALTAKVDPIVVTNNLAIGYEWHNGYYNGEENSSNSYKYLAAIPVENGKKYRVLPRCRMIYIMNASGREINHVSADNTMEITAGGDGFAYVTFYKNDDLSHAVFYEDNARFPYPEGIQALGDDVKSSPLRGKKWAVLGDSFSAGADSGTLTDGIYKGEKIVYPYIIGNRTGIRVLNFFEHGRTLAYPSDGTFHNSVTDPNQDWYYQNIPADVDYITIYLGINDSHHAPGSGGGDGESNTGEIPLGTASDNTTATYYGAWNVVLAWLRENRPFAHMGIIVSNGCDTADYRTAMIEMAQKYGLPYIDLNGDERTPAMIRAQNSNIPSAVRNIIRDAQAVNVAGGNTHPNNAAHMFESTFIENFLCSI